MDGKNDYHPPTPHPQQHPLDHHLPGSSLVHMVSKKQICHGIGQFWLSHHYQQNPIHSHRPSLLPPPRTSHRPKGLQTYWLETTAIRLLQIKLWWISQLKSRESECRCHYQRLHWRLDQQLHQKYRAHTLYGSGALGPLWWSNASKEP